jgi:hypothetical protein
VDPSDENWGSGAVLPGEDEVFLKIIKIIKFFTHGTVTMAVPLVKLLTKPLGER